MPETFNIQCAHLDALLDHNEILVETLVGILRTLAPDWETDHPDMAELIRKLRRETKATRASLEAYRTETP